MEKLGPSAFIQYLNGPFGFPEKFSAFLSLALGAQDVSPLDMARGYSVFMTGGDRVDPYCIDHIVGPDGQVVRKYDPKITTNVLSADVVNQMRDLQLAVVESGTATRVVNGKVPNARGKTGTTSDNKDAWFDGYSDGLLCIAWVANQQGVGANAKSLPMSSRIFGGTTATQIWVPIMKAAHEKFAVPQPDRGSSPDNSDSHFASGQDNQDNNHDQQNNGDQTTTDSGNADSGNTDSGAPQQTTPNPSAPTPDNLPPVETLKPIEQPKPKPPPVVKKVEYVTVEICADSHERSTDYCPETVMRTYVKGTEPKTYCHIHTGH